MVVERGELLPILAGVEDAAICGACGGECCQRYPGLCDPGEFGEGALFVERVVECLRSGMWVIDWWWGDPRLGRSYFVPPELLLDRVYFVRPAHLEGDVGGGWLDESEGGGECVFWDSGSGCRLEFSNRPEQCRTLVPCAEGRCENPEGGSKRGMVVRWVGYAGLMSEVLGIMKRECDL